MLQMKKQTPGREPGLGVGTRCGRGSWGEWAWLLGWGGGVDGRARSGNKVPSGLSSQPPCHQTRDPLVGSLDVPCVCARWLVKARCRLVGQGWA